MNSVYFSDCFGVFQGGGVRAAALAGAYGEAWSAGVRFSAVAGTSAGSIAAILVGAGASPEYIEKALRSLDFRSLLRVPDRHGEFSSRGPRTIGTLIAPLGLFSPPLKIASKLMRYGGLYSSRGIEEWVEAKLRELLPNVKSPVTFGDLLIPTFVIATSLGTQSAKVWSKKENSHDSVALAVRASCSIPTFFQPVLIGDSRLVDGGVLSNLPAFVFENEHITARRILAFRLVGSERKTSEWGPKEMVSQLIDTIVNGAAQIQVNLLRTVSCIDIPTDGILATDFDKMTPAATNSLIDGGRKATKDFFASEVMRIGSTEVLTDLIRDRDQVYLEVVRQTSKLPDEVVIAEQNSEWYWKLFPTVLYWRARGVKVRVLLLPVSTTGSDADNERFRRNNMRRIGVTLHEAEMLPLQGYFFRRALTDDSAVILFLSHRIHGPLAERYIGHAKQQVIQLLLEKITSQFKVNDSGPTFVPSLVPADGYELCQALNKGVRQYSHQDVSVKIEYVPVKQLRSITKLVRAYKYEQMIFLAELLRERGIELFSPVKVTLSDGGTSLMCPPVFEIHSDNLYIGVAGNTRTYYSFRHGLTSIAAVIVRGVKDTLPGRSVAVQEASLIEFDGEPAMRMPDFNYSNFRRIEWTCQQYRT